MIEKETFWDNLYDQKWYTIIALFITIAILYSIIP